MSPGVEDTEEDMGDYNGIRTAAGDLGRGGQQPGGSEEVSSLVVHLYYTTFYKKIK